MATIKKTMSCDEFSAEVTVFLEEPTNYKLGSWFGNGKIIKSTTSIIFCFY